MIISNAKLVVQSLSKTFDFLPKWRNFAKSGHTGRDAKTADNDDNYLGTFFSVSLSEAFLSRRSVASAAYLRNSFC